jgi:hypothetical protein
MNAEDFRHSKRRACERRLNERRLVHFLFGSVEWQKNIEHQYVMWPRTDRRALDRRALERRNISRRRSAGCFNKGPRLAQPVKPGDILSKEERAMLADLF